MIKKSTPSVFRGAFALLYVVGSQYRRHDFGELLQEVGGGVVLDYRVFVRHPRQRD